MRWRKVARKLNLVPKADEMALVLKCTNVLPHPDGSQTATLQAEFNAGEPFPINPGGGGGGAGPRPMAPVQDLRRIVAPRVGVLVTNWKERPPFEVGKMYRVDISPV